MAKFKIGVWILDDYKPEAGGGFSLYSKLIRLIDDYQFDEALEICFIGNRKIESSHFSKNYIQLKSLAAFPKLVLRACNKIRYFRNVFNEREREELNKHDIKLIYYPIQTLCSIHNFPFIATNWDIGHKSTFAFPELNMNSTFESREKWYNTVLQKALAVFAESESGKKELLIYTKINPERISVVPLLPGGIVDLKVTDLVLEEKLQALSLTKHKYFFYPAQFWAHKNHYNLLKAFGATVKHNADLKLVFTGSDKGNKNYIKQCVTKLGLNNQVVFLGFIDNESMVTLYRNALAMVMPSFLGPTNMPLLEAREMDCPVVCSDISGHREIMKTAALYFEPSNVNSIVECLIKILDSDFRKQLIQTARQDITQSVFTKEHTLDAMNKAFLKIIPIRNTWGYNDKIF